MSFSILKHFRPRQTPQAEPIPGLPMVPNSAGGYAFAVDDWKRLERFLVLGSEGGSYYATERQLTIENAQAVVRCLDADPARAIRTIVAISDSGRAPKNDPAMFALAIAAGHGPRGGPRGRCRGSAAPGRTCSSSPRPSRASAGWGRALRKAVAAWYEGKGRRRPGLPGRQVPAARRLVAPRPAAAVAPSPRPTRRARRSTAGWSAAARPSARARSSGATRWRRTPTSRPRCPGCSMRWTRPGRPTARGDDRR